MPDKTMHEQKQRFCDLMQKIDRLYEAYAKARGMTYMSMTVLETICTHRENCTQKLICDETHYPKQSVNLVVKAFWQAGYVTLQELPEDRRNKRIVLTEKGEGYAKGTVDELWRIDESATARLTEPQREELLRLLALYADAYEQGVREAIG